MSLLQIRCCQKKNRPQEVIARGEGLAQLLEEVGKGMYKIRQTQTGTCITVGEGNDRGERYVFADAILYNALTRPCRIQDLPDGRSMISVVHK